MIRRNMLTVACLALALAISALFGQAASAGQPKNHNHNHSHNSGGKKVVFGSGGGSFQNHNHNHHGHNHHSHQPFIGPVIKVPVSQPVRVLYCVVIREPGRFNDWNFHQVKCFYSLHEAEFFAASLRNTHLGENGFAVRIDRRW